jgi:hypothetical protein
MSNVREQRRVRDVAEHQRTCMTLARQPARQRSTALRQPVPEEKQRRRTRPQLRGGRGLR